MATLLIWALMVQLIKRSSQMDCKRDVLKNTPFDCELQLTRTESSLKCEDAFRIGTGTSSKYFVLQLYRMENGYPEIDLETLFTSFLNSSVSTKSRFYSCDSIWRSFIAADPELLSDNCERYGDCELTFIDESYLRRVEVTKAGSVDVFKGLDSFPFVEEVNIRDTSLTNISEVQFGYSEKLRILTLRGNGIKSLPNGIFVGLINLENLDLSRNKIRSIANNPFGNLTSLKILNLSFNSLADISSEAFNNTPNLREIYLQNNKLRSINDELFSFNKYLTKIDLSCNNLKQLSASLFRGLQNLEEISCSQCKLDDLEHNLLMNLTKLSKVDFSINEIKLIPKAFFQTQHFIVNITLGYNRLSEMPELKNKTYLKFLDLYHNEISSIDENLSQQAHGLYYLNVGDNKLSYLADKHVKSFLDLEYFYLVGNNITTIELGMTTDLKIRKLNLTNNNVSTLKVNWPRFSYLEELHMEYNKLTHLVLPPCIPSIKRTITFSFQYNNIAKLDTYPLIKDQNRVKTDQPMASDCFFNGLSKNFVDLSHNPLHCDCYLYPFYNYIKQDNGVKLDAFLNLKEVTCFSPKLLQNASINQLTADAFSCYFSANCPEPCTCGIRGKDNRTFVNCTETGLAEFPQDIPVETTVLYFIHNNVEHLTTFNNSLWDNLVEIHLDSNKLSTLEDWKIPPKLEYLSLRDNKLTNLPQTLMDFISNKSEFELFLGGNDKNCGCNSKTLRDFIVENAAFVKDTDDIRCEIDTNGTISQFPLHSILDGVLCIKTYVVFDPKVTIVSMSIVFTFLLSMLLVYYKQRQLILSFLYIHCSEVFHVCFEENDADDDKVFDAFVAYSSSDRQIVMDILQELEEKEPHFQLCIHERNWLPGRFISDNIISSVQNSKRTLVILSNNFIASPWFRLELRAAIFKVSGDRKNKIIVVLADKSTSLEGIDTELRHIVSKRTYLVWGERWFWEKLRYAMPRKSCLENNEEQHFDNTDGNKRDSEIALMESI